MKLITSYTSPYGRKARIICSERNIPFEVVEDNPWTPDAKIRAANPLGRVPALVLADGTALFDSRVICEYLDESFPGTRFIPERGSARFEVKRLEALADGILDSGVYVFLERKRDAALQNKDMIDRRIGQIKACLDEAKKLVDGKQFAHGNAISMADVALGAAIGWINFRLPDLKATGDRPALANYIDGLHQRASFSSTVPPAA
jgi:glutathione S-transferase